MAVTINGGTGDYSSTWYAYSYPIFHLLLTYEFRLRPEMRVHLREMHRTVRTIDVRRRSV